MNNYKGNFAVETDLQQAAKATAHPAAGRLSSGYQNWKN